MLLTGSPPSQRAAGPGLVGGAPQGREGVDVARLALQPLGPALLRAACGNVGGTAGTSCIFKDLPCQLWTRDAPQLCPGFLSQPYASSVASSFSPKGRRGAAWGTISLQKAQRFGSGLLGSSEVTPIR